MGQLFDFPIKMFHMELTNKCALACPRCPRTGKDMELRELPLFLIKKRFSKKICEKVDEVDLGGALGDCIYHSNLADILRHFAHSGIKRINLETNGTGRSKSWWRDIRRTLRPSDIVIFSIDGLSDTNQIYRVNSNWKQIMEGVSELSGHVNLWWKFIVFKHNQHQIDEAKELAKKLGFNKFQLMKSKLFGGDWRDSKGNDPLMPDEENISKRVLFFETGFRKKQILVPRCRDSGHHFVSSDGIYFPCCWLEGRRNKLESLGLRGDEFNLFERSLVEVFKDERLNRLRDMWQNLDRITDSCGRYCFVHEGATNQNVESQHDRFIFELN